MKFWDERDQTYYMKDQNAFLFNLSSKKIFKVTQPELAIGSDQNLEFFFGKDALSVSKERERMKCICNSD